MINRKPAIEANRPIRPLFPNMSSEEGGREMAVASKVCKKEEEMDAVLPNEEVEPQDGEELQADIDDVQPQKMLRTPIMPSQAEVDEHNIDHLPYRAWCRSCVSGRGQEAPHGHVEQHRRTISVVSFDYFFVTKNGAYTKQEWNLLAEDQKDPDHLKVLVVKDYLNKFIFAHAVERKGADDGGYIVECIVRDVQWLGYSKVILKTDNEASIVQVLRESLKALRVEGLEQAAEEHPPALRPAGERRHRERGEVGQRAHADDAEWVAAASW